MPAKKSTRIPFGLYQRFRSQGFSPKEAKQKTNLFQSVYQKKRGTGLSPTDSWNQTQKAFRKLAVVQSVKQREMVGTRGAVEFLEKLSTAGTLRDSLQARLKSRGFGGNISVTEARVFDQALLNELADNPVLAQKWKESSPSVLGKVLDAYAELRMKAFRTKTGKSLPQTTAEPRTVIVCLLRALQETFPDFSPEPSERERILLNLKATNPGPFRAEEPYGFLRRLVRELSNSGYRTVPLEQQQHTLKLWLELELDSFSQKKFRTSILRDLQNRFPDFNRSPNAVQQRRIEESPVTGRIVERLAEKNRQQKGVARMMRDLFGTAPGTEPGNHPEELLFKMLSIRNNRLFVRKQLVRKVLPEFFKKSL